jgi:hypothetical protein
MRVKRVARFTCTGKPVLYGPVLDVVRIKRYVCVNRAVIHKYTLSDGTTVWEGEVRELNN